DKSSAAEGAALSLCGLNMGEKKSPPPRLLILLHAIEGREDVAARGSKARPLPDSRSETAGGGTAVKDIGPHFESQAPRVQGPAFPYVRPFAHDFVSADAAPKDVRKLQAPFKIPRAPQGFRSEA